MSICTYLNLCKINAVWLGWTSWGNLVLKTKKIVMYDDLPLRCKGNIIKWHSGKYDNIFTYTCHNRVNKLGHLMIFLFACSKREICIHILKSMHNTAYHMGLNSNKLSFRKYFSCLSYKNKIKIK